MLKMTPDEWRRVGEAIVIWSGWDRARYPSRKAERLVEHFGADAASALLPVVRELEDAFYASDARHTAADLTEMANISAEQFRQKYPQLPEEAVRALAWCYTFDYK